VHTVLHNAWFYEMKSVHQSPGFVTLVRAGIFKSISDQNFSWPRPHQLQPAAAMILFRGK